MFLRGILVVQNDETAAAWCNKSQAKGNSRARLALALLYHLGRGVIYSEDEAISWYQEAANHGDLDAIFNLATLYYKTGDFAKSFKSFLKAADNGDAQACNIIASMYQRGQGVQYNIDQAVQWYRKAANAGYAQAQNSLAYMYALGRGVQIDRTQARKWFESAAEQGLNIAQQNISLLEQKQSGFTLVSHVADMDVRAKLLFEKPLDLTRQLDRYKTP